MTLNTNPKGHTQQHTNYEIGHTQQHTNYEIGHSQQHTNYEIGHTQQPKAPKAKLNTWMWKRTLCINPKEHTEQNNKQKLMRSDCTNSMGTPSSTLIQS
jgi:hypothetical protein